MDLPDEIFALIGEFIMSFPNLNDHDKFEAKTKLARTIVALYPEYIDYIVENYKIPNYKNFKRFCDNVEAKFRKNAEAYIKKYELDEFRDVIMENSPLYIPHLINIIEYCFERTKDITKTCTIYCNLGYADYNNRDGNEDYLLNFMNQWVDFSMRKGIDKRSAQIELLKTFEQIDYPNERCEICDFFPFTNDRVDNLVDYTLELDYYDLDEFKAKNGLLSASDIPEHALINNYYVYIFNKLNPDCSPYAFAVRVFSKWLEYNIPILSQYFIELHPSDLHSLLIEYSTHRYGSLSPFREFRSFALIEILYKLYYKTPLSHYDLADIWVYFVINKALSYSNHKLHETAAILRVAEIKYPEDGGISLPWKYVRFVDGKAFFYHPNHEKGVNATLPFILESEQAHKSFMNISKSILWNFPYISCRCDKGKIIAIDEEFARYIISDIDLIDQAISNKESILSSANLSANDILLRIKSQQLTLLKKKQIKKYDIICILETVSNTNILKEEPALLFTIGENIDTFTLVYENTNYSRASYIFIINKHSYINAVKIIKQYFTSNNVNKRVELQYSRDMFNLEDGFLRVIRIRHDENKNWENAINFYSKQ